MYSPIPASFLFWSIPFLFTPNIERTACFSGQSYAEFSEFKMGLKQAKNVGLELEHRRLADFGQQSIAASTGISLHEHLNFDAGLQFIRSFQSRASHTQVHVNTSLLFSQELSQSLVYVSLHPARKSFEFKAAHLYELDPHWRLGMEWDSKSNALQILTHYTTDRVLLTFSLAPEYQRLGFALKYQQLWIQIALNTGSTINAPVLLGQW